ncbi:TPA: DEAD/DEAH box helicase family protein [Vibrio parahaemolyticus]|nr:DEAD/DEAH box helicase family protein [Vibrio parahaemolyticus]HCM0447528.1 DEAD/DEAH box helicase family protein [Vibrio parahaemolyticus]
MYFELKSWQKSFVENYSNSSDFLSTLVAQTGSGKTITSLLAAKEHLQSRGFESVIILTDRIQLMLQWRQVAQDLNLSVGSLETTLNRFN